MMMFVLFGICALGYAPLTASDAGYRAFSVRASCCEPWDEAADVQCATHGMLMACHLSLPLPLLA
jgi:hypothetical protein